MGVKTVAAGEFYKTMGEGATFLDVRTAGEYREIHAAGAALAPLDEMDAGALASAARGSGKAIYVICKSGGRSAKACEALTAAGAPAVYSIEGGTDAWAKEGLPVERGRGGVISLERQVRIAAGGLVLVGSVLGMTVHWGFTGIAAFVGVGLVFAGITNTCGMGMALSRMPWNR